MRIHFAIRPNVDGKGLSLVMGRDRKELDRRVRETRAFFGDADEARYTRGHYEMEGEATVFVSYPVGPR